MSKAPTLRQPTRRERLAFKLFKRWPESYVDARLNHLDAIERYDRVTNAPYGWPGDDSIRRR